MSVPYDWEGFYRRKLSPMAGEVLCIACGARWVIRACWIDNPSQQCIAALQLHATRCPKTPPAQRKQEATNVV